VPGWGLPAPLAEAYAGDLGFTLPCTYANFVASLDGVAALGPEYPSSGSAISGGDDADRFVMGLLRACADAVLIGAGTLRATPGHRWTLGYVCPAAAAGFAAMRRSLRRAAEPELVVVTARGDLPAGHPALQAGALVATTTAGARRLAGRLPSACTVLAVAEGPALRMTGVLSAIRARGHAAVLTEGGPRLLGEDLLDELFLTIAPMLAGRAGTGRTGLIAGLALLPGQLEWAEMISARRRGSYLFLRYRLQRTHDQGGGA
jgi:riboflavin biosynthesis pyrimidine reductase